MLKKYLISEILETNNIGFNIIPNENFKSIRIITNIEGEKYNLDIINFNDACLKDIVEKTTINEFKKYINTRKILNI